jgi:hypothetical protein
MNPNSAKTPCKQMRNGLALAQGIVKENSKTTCNEVAVQVSEDRIVSIYLDQKG